MMACLADRLVAAPFAIIGSIGVLVQLPNFHRVLKKYDVDYEIISAGEYKRTLTHFGEITNKGKDKVKEDVENIHQIFKDWVKTYRPSVEIDTIATATGETWVGSQAKDRYMVDDIKTSDECVIEACETSDVYEIKFEIKKPLQVRLASLLEESAHRLISRWFGKSDHDTYQRDTKMAEQFFEAYRVSENAENNFESAIIKRSISELTPSDVLIKVSYSSLNYKDALSASGNKGVTREFPHTPGIDAAGVVVSSKSKILTPAIR